MTASMTFDVLVGAIVDPVQPLAASPMRFCAAMGLDLGALADLSWRRSSKTRI